MFDVAQDARQNRIGQLVKILRRKQQRQAEFAVLSQYFFSTFVAWRCTSSARSRCSRDACSGRRRQVKCRSMRYRPAMILTASAVHPESSMSTMSPSSMTLRVFSALFVWPRMRCREGYAISAPSLF